MRYKVWQSNKDKYLHLLCGEGPAAFSALPAAIRHLGPWKGGAEGDVNRLRLPYRSMLAEPGFVVIYKHLQAHVEAPIGDRRRRACALPAVQRLWARVRRTTV